MSRSVRRHHRERLMRKRVKYGTVGGRGLGRVVSTPCPCSCWMCSNVRAYLGQSVQERRNEINFVEGMG